MGDCKYIYTHIYANKSYIKSYSCMWMEKDSLEYTVLHAITLYTHIYIPMQHVFFFFNTALFTIYSKWLTSRWLGCLPTDAYPKTEMIYTWTKGPQHSVEVPPESSSLVQYDLIGQTVSSETIKSITGEAHLSFHRFELSAEFTWMLQAKCLLELMWWTLSCPEDCKICSLLLKAKMPSCLCFLWQSWYIYQLCFPQEWQDKHCTIAARVVDIGRIWSFDSRLLKSNTVNIMHWGISEDLSVQMKHLKKILAAGNCNWSHVSIWVRMDGVAKI